MNKRHRSIGMIFQRGVRDSLEEFAVLMNLGMRDLLSKQMDFLQCMGR